MLPRGGWVLMGTGSPDEPCLIGDSEQIRHFRNAVRVRIERAADAGGDLRDIPPAVLLSLLCASGFSAVAGAMAQAPTLGSLSSQVVLIDLISAAIDDVRAGSQGRPRSPHDLERQIYWRIERVLAAQDQSAAVLRTEISKVLAETDAMRSALGSAIETGNDRLRNDVISAIETLSGAYPEMAFLARAGDHEAAQMQRRLDGQGAQFRTLSGMVRHQSADTRAWEDLATIRHHQTRGARGETADAGRGPHRDSGCPYRGLLPFDQEHAGVFFGRQQLTAELIAKLAGRLARPSIVVVSGASGAGKSSLLHAGLLPALTAGIQLQGSDGWPRVVMTPTGDPLSELATRLATLGRGDATAARARLAADPDRAHLVVGQAIVDGAGRGNGAHPPAAVWSGPLLLVVDQFEEVFTLAPARGDGGQQAFIAALCATASQPFGPRGEPAAMVIIAVRGDFWARCAAHAGLARLMQDGMFVVGPMTGPELREAITGPAAAAGLRLDPDLADTVLADLRTAGQNEAEGVLPLLSQAMMLTWQRRDGNCLTVPGYHETGGVARSVEFGAEAIYQALPDAGQQVAREIFQALVLVGPDGQLGRRAVPRAELTAGRRDAARRTVGTVLEAFASSRLLVLDGDTAQIAHDVVLRAWPRLRGWLDGEQANWILYTQLQEDAAEWAARGRDSSFLYRGSQLAAVERATASWVADPARYPALTGDESGFLAASRQHAARSARTRRFAVLALALLLVLSLAGAGIAARADRTANQQRNAAVSNQLAAESEALDATNPVTAAALATAAWKIDPTADARTSLLDVLAQPERGAITVAGGNVETLAFSPDGKRFATATDSGEDQIWDTATRREIGKPARITNSLDPGSIWFENDETAVTFARGAGLSDRFWSISAGRPIGPGFRIASENIGSAIVNPNGTALATEGGNNDLRFLNVATRSKIGATVRDAAPLAFSPDGKLLAVGVPYGEGFEGAVRLIDVASQKLISPPIPSSGLYEPAAAFSPDGKILAVTGSDSVTFQDVRTGHEIGTPLAVPANGLAYSPNGKILATISPVGTRSSAATVNLWDAVSHQELGGAVTVDATALLGFSPDSTTLITADGSTINFWDVAISRPTGALIGGATGSVAFSPNGQILAAESGHGAGLWNLATRREIGTPVQTGTTDGATNVAFSPDGQTLATAGIYGAGAQLWDVATHRQIARSTPDGWTWENAVAFSPDGKYLVIGTDVGSGGVAGRAWLWDIRTNRLVGPPMINGDNSLSTVAFSPDGKLIATADQQVKLFSVTTQRPVGAPLATGMGPVNDMAFSPDGGMIAVATNSGVTLWDVASRRQIGNAINVGVGPAQVLTFSPDGMILAVAGQDGTIRLWDVAGREQIGAPLAVNQNQIEGIAFSPDGTLLAATNPFGTRLWGVALTRDTVSRVCAIAGGSMTRQQWSSYVESEPFQATCS
jgi:WD40 repeat protein